MQFGHIPLICIPSDSSGFAKDRIAPTTPCFETPYIGPTGNGYNPAFEAVHIIEPFLAEVFFLI